MPRRLPVQGCATCVSQRCCETHCCAWLECQCGDCDMCGGTLSVEYSSAELARVQKSQQRDDEAEKAEATAAAAMAEAEAARAARAREAAEHERVLKGLGLKFIAPRDTQEVSPAPTTTTTTTTTPSVSSNTSKNSRGEKEDPRITAARETSERAQAVSDKITQVIANGSETMASVRDLQQRFEDMDAQFKNALSALAGALGGGSAIEINLSSSERTAVLGPTGGTKVASIAKGLQQGLYRKIVVMAGAGISTSAGIPDFRTPGSGLYDNLQKYNIPTPQSIFDVDYFRENPQPFTYLARELFPGKYRPTPTHAFIRLLQDKGVLHRVYTQNIDSLERIVGIHDDKLVEAHGTFAKAHCINTNCQTEMDINVYRQGVISGTPPTCKQCRAYVKPDIVFFGEPLPHRFSILMETDFVQCDLLIVIGTSLSVQPFAGLITKPLLTVPRLLINQNPVAMEIGFDPPLVKKLKTKTSSRPQLTRTGSGVTSTRGGTAQAEQEAEEQAAAQLASEMETNHLRGGFRFGSPDNYRDVYMRGPCDASVQRLVTACGWEREFAHVLQRNKIPLPVTTSNMGKGKGSGVRTTSSRTSVKK